MALWGGHRWTADNDGAIQRIAVEFARNWQRAALDIPDLDRRTKTTNFALKLERRDGLANLLTLASAVTPIADTGDGWDGNAWLMGVPNGVLDLKTGRLRDGRRDDRITMCTAVPFEAAATCPKWEQFFAEIFGGEPELISFVHRAIGYSLTGDTGEQVCFMAHGGGSGKGTLTNTVKSIVGDFGGTCRSPRSNCERAGIPNDVAAPRVGAS